jgi:LPS sulfotransferase NodH
MSAALRRSISLRHPLVQHLVLALGLKPSGNSYTRFVILGRSRTGSNFLRGLLGSRGDVATLGEVFKNPAEIEWGTEDFPIGLGSGALYKRDPVAFLHRSVFRRMPLDVKAVGFKLFYYHARSGSRKRVWSHLRQLDGLRIIHIKRRNILRTCLSRERAARNGRWVAKAPSAAKQRPIELSIEHCEQEFIRTRRWERTFDCYFEAQPVYELIYEDLARDFTTQMTRIAAFLDLQPKHLEPQTYQQASLPLRDAISNFDELQDRFRATEWSEFFVEP